MFDPKNGIFSYNEVYLGYGSIDVEGFSYSNLPTRIGSVKFISPDNNPIVELAFKDVETVDKLIDLLIDFKDKFNKEIDWREVNDTDYFEQFRTDIFL